MAEQQKTIPVVWADTGGTRPVGEFDDLPILSRPEDLDLLMSYASSLVVPFMVEVPRHGPTILRICIDGLRKPKSGIQFFRGTVYRFWRSQEELLTNIQATSFVVDGMLPSDSRGGAINLPIGLVDGLQGYAQDDYRCGLGDKPIQVPTATYRRKW